MQLKKCPLCGSPKIQRINEDFKAVIHGKKRAIPDVERQKCFSCGEEFFDHTSNEKLDAFRRKSKAAA
jgi:YgiT-type zinc finger domain-containing protein